MESSPNILESGVHIEEESESHEFHAIPLESSTLKKKSSLLGPPRATNLLTDVQMKRIRWPIISACIIFCVIFISSFTYLPILGKTPFSINWLALWDSYFAKYTIVQSSITDARTKPQDLLKDPRLLTEIPQYVIDYAPLVHLYSEEQFWPCDMAEHLHHVTPELDYTPIEEELQYLNLTNLDNLNEYGKGRHVYLTSKDNVEERPDWLGGKKNIPDDFIGDWKMDSVDEEKTQSGREASQKGRQGGRSDAPAVLILVNKGNGIVDAFWFYFYSYNLGNLVLNVRFGNHIGDWEHNLIRFQHGKPKLVFFSEHNWGAAYSYDAVEKIGKRPVVYSATGTHAMYATPAAHPYILPLGLLHDQTDRGPLWDPTLNAHTYTYNHLTDTLRPANHTPHAPTQWFYFAGHWGDKFYPLADDRQYGLLGEYHYVSGPLGPRFKHLGRRKVCQGRYEDPCVIRHRLEDEEVVIAPGIGTGEEETGADEAMTMPFVE